MQNLILRIISSFFLILFFYSILGEIKQLFVLSIFFLISMSVWEFLRLSSFRLIQNNLFEKTGFFLTRQKIDFFDHIIIILLNFLCFLLIKNYIYLFFISFISFLLLLILQKISLEKIFGILYISLPIFFIIQLSNEVNFQTYIFFIIFYSITTDVSSFLVGKTFGGMKLAPRISPGKTLSGSLGGIILPLFFSLIFFSNSEVSLFLICVSSVLFSLIVQIGDLIESSFKRYCFVKESSNLIPGHGGVLDRFDGFLLLTFFVYILKIFNFNFYFII